jgi:putative ABC transport system substrate-binding protein
LPIVGVLAAASSATAADFVNAERAGLGDAGLIEAQNFVFDYRCANNQYDRLLQLAADLVRRKAAVIIARGGSSAQFARADIMTSGAGLCSPSRHGDESGRSS